MKIRNIAYFTALILAPLSTVRAQTAIADWTFDNSGITAPVINPVASSGVNASTAYAVTIGMTNNLTPTPSIGAPDVIVNPAASTGAHPAGTGYVDSTPALPDAWRIRAKGTTPNTGNGWSDAAPVATQGAQFHASTLGYYDVKLTFDITATTTGEGYVAVQYTTDGVTWNTAPLAYPTNPGLILNNSTPGSGTNGIVIGSYLSMLEAGTFVQVWFTNVTADFTGINAANNNTNFAVRIINACTGTNCVSAASAALNNTSGNWSLDNVAISGNAVAPITAWTFENYTNLATLTGTFIVDVDHPSPTTGMGTATALGFTTSWVFQDSVSSMGSQSFPDVTIQTGSSSGPNGPCCWRVRGQYPTAPAGSNMQTGNGWNSQQDIGTQGAEFDVSTYNYDTVLVTFDLFFTGQAESKMQVEYTIDGVNWTNAAMLVCPSNPSLIQTNPASGGSGSTVVGTYMNMTVTGGGWFNGMMVDLTGVPGVTNNPNFGIRVVNAATGTDCTAPNGGPYNNSSGNCRFDNVVVSGRFNGPPAPTIIPDASATVDGPFTNTFTPAPSWQYNITKITVNGTLLPPSAYNTNVSGEIIFTPSASALLQLNGSKTIIVSATSFIDDIVIQPLGSGVATKLSITTQPASPSASGGTLIAQPTLTIVDQYGNGTTNPYSNVNFTATVGGSGGWTLGGTTAQAIVNGVASFTNLSATLSGPSAVANAVITFTTSGYGASPVITNSASFSIGTPPVPYTPGNLAVVQLDNVTLNSTFSILELNPSVANQTKPINIVPISASNGTNSMRLTSSGSDGRLSLSDDGTLLCFVGFLDGSSLTTDEASFSPFRGVGTLDYTNGFNCPVQYGPVSVAGGTQGRSASTIDNVNYVIADKNGIFINNANLVTDNTRVIRSFGGTIYLMSATSPKTVVNYLSGSSVIPLFGLPTDGNAMDFYMVSSGVNGAAYDVLYVLDSKVNTITKYINTDGSFPGNWSVAGTIANADGADGLLAATNGNGGVYLYYTTGAGGTASNSVVRKTDSIAFTASVNVIDTNTIFTATATTSLKGLSFVPQHVPYAGELTPPPVLTAASGVLPGSPFSIALSPEDATWRSAITGITVNGSTLPPAAYDKTQAGIIAFNPALSGGLLQSPGSKTIVVGATGYSADSVSQAITGTATPPTLNGIALAGGKLTFTFTNTTGLSFSVLATNNLTAPVSTWPVIGTAVEGPAQTYSFTNATPATNGQQYFILRQP